MQGTDLVLYIKFVKYQAYLFFVLMMLDVSVLIPTYLTGHPKDDAQISDFSKLTIVKSSADSPRIWVSFIFVFLNSVIALLGVYKYWITSLRLTNRRLESA